MLRGGLFFLLASDDDEPHDGGAHLEHRERGAHPDHNLVCFGHAFSPAGCESFYNLL